jgi:RNA polymerase primary sigma factor
MKKRQNTRFKEKKTGETMLDQSVFTETIHEVAEIIRTSATPLSKEEILSYFKEMELNEQQENMVLEFLLTPHEEEDAEEEEAEETEAEEAQETAEWQDTTDASVFMQSDSDKKEAETKKADCLPESKMFQMYLEEISSLPVYSETKIEEMYQKLLAGDESVIHTISDSWMIKVLELAKKLAVSSEGFEDVIQEGNMALFLKLTELCGSQEKTDVEAELQNAVEEAMKSSILAEEGEDEDEKAMVGKLALVNEAKKYLADEKGREATLSELAEYTQLTEEELSDILLLIQKANQKDK